MKLSPELERGRQRIETPKRLSVLIPTLPTRLRPLDSLLRELESQIGDRDDVEVLALLDLKTRWLGDKRNQLMDLAQGEYLTFINDDDEIAPNWLDRVLHHLDANPGVDVLSIRAECMVRDTPNHPWRHAWYMLTSLAAPVPAARLLYPDPDGLRVNPDGVRHDAIFLHSPVMWCVWRSEIARKARFPGKNYSEDTAWAQQAGLFAKSEAVVEEVLYRYYADDRTSEAGPWMAIADPFAMQPWESIAAWPHVSSNFERSEVAHEAAS